MKTLDRPSIPPPEVVRFVAAILLVIPIAIIVIAIMHFTALGWLFATGLIASGLASIYCEIKALSTGDPEWILLDLIIR